MCSASKSYQSNDIHIIDQIINKRIKKKTTERKEKKNASIHTRPIPLARPTLVSLSPHHKQSLTHSPEAAAHNQTIHNRSETMPVISNDDGGDGRRPIPECTVPFDDDDAPSALPPIPVPL